MIIISIIIIIIYYARENRSHRAGGYAKLSTLPR